MGIRGIRNIGLDFILLHFMFKLSLFFAALSFIISLFFAFLSGVALASTLVTGIFAAFLFGVLGFFVQIILEKKVPESLSLFKGFNSALISNKKDSPTSKRGLAHDKLDRDSYKDFVKVADTKNSEAEQHSFSGKESLGSTSIAKPSNSDKASAKGTETKLKSSMESNMEDSLSDGTRASNKYGDHILLEKSKIDKNPMVLVKAIRTMIT